MRKQKVKHRRRAQLASDDRALIRRERATSRAQRTEEAAAKERSEAEGARGARRERVAQEIAGGARACPNCDSYIDRVTLHCADAPRCDIWSGWQDPTPEGEARQLEFRQKHFDL